MSWIGRNLWWGRGMRWDWLNPLVWLPGVLCGVFLAAVGLVALAAIVRAEVGEWERAGAGGIRGGVRGLAGKVR